MVNEERGPLRFHSPFAIHYLPRHRFVFIHRSPFTIHYSLFPPPQRPQPNLRRDAPIPHAEQPPAGFPLEMLVQIGFAGHGAPFTPILGALSARDVDIPTAQRQIVSNSLLIFRLLRISLGGMTHSSRR
jgi:hypothetical protein